MLDVVWSNTILPLKEWEWGRPPNEWAEADFCNSCWRWCWLLIHISWRSCSFWISFFVRPRILNPRYFERKRSFEVRTVFSFIMFKKNKDPINWADNNFLCIKYFDPWPGDLSLYSFSGINAPCLISQERIFQVIKQTVSSMFWLFWPLTLDLVQAIYSLKVLTTTLCLSSKKFWSYRRTISCAWPFFLLTILYFFRCTVKQIWCQVDNTWSNDL